MTNETTSRRPKVLWSPAESADFYRDRITECEKMVKQIEDSLLVLPQRISEKTKYSKHHTSLIVAARKRVYDAMLNTCEKHIKESKKLIKWIETGVQPT